MKQSNSRHSRARSQDEKDFFLAISPLYDASAKDIPEIVALSDY